MNVKRYIGKDANEAMQKVKQEMGSNAVILHTRKIKQKGLKGLFSKSLVEVVAAIEEKTNAKPRVNKPNPIQETLQKTVLEEQRKQAETYKTHQEITALQEQMQTLTSMVQNIIINKSQQTSEEHSGQVDTSEDVFMDNKYIKNLIENNVDEEIIIKIKNIIMRQINITTQTEETVKNTIKVVIRDMLGLSYRIESIASKQKIYFFVGPTGVGKTTTLAKIAAKLSLVDNKSVALVTADTYRIAAVDQLKTYSEILSIPLEVIYEAEEIKSVLKKHDDKEFVLVDTAGRNHKDEALHVDLQNLIEATGDSEIFLVMSLTSSARDVKSILNSYSFIDDFKLIFTKLDEAETYGNVINARSFSNKPLAFITNGQSVPDDIVVADADRLAELLLGD